MAAILSFSVRSKVMVIAKSAASIKGLKGCSCPTVIRYKMIKFAVQLGDVIMFLAKVWRE